MRFHHLAQMNVARALAPVDSPALADFHAQIDEINRLAESSPGFVWRLKDEASGNATGIQAFDGDAYLLTNMSVWESVQALREYVYQSAHVGVFKQRAKWFEKPAAAHQVMWWIPAGHVPSPQEGQTRLHQLRKVGSSPVAFTFSQNFAPPDAPALPATTDPAPFCLDGRRFRVLSNSAHGDVGAGLVFTYRQQGRRVWSFYEGAGATPPRFGMLVAAMDDAGALDMRYQHLDAAGVLRTGRCLSTPRTLGSGRLRYDEAWEWTNGELSRGESVLEEATRLA